VADADQIVDITVIGGGPTGLAAAYYGGHRDATVRIVESLEQLGGQVSAVYPEKHIFDVAGFPKINGQALIDQLTDQAMQYAPDVRLGTVIETIEHRDDETIALHTADGETLLTRTMIVTAGHGAFEPRKLGVDTLEAFAGNGLHYYVREKAAFTGKRVALVGGGDSALDWALNFTPGNEDGNQNKAESVILVHRRDGFRAAPASVARMHELCEQMEMQFIVGQVTGHEEKDGKLAAVKVTGGDGVTRTVPLDVLLVFFGLSPKLGPIADWGLDIERKQLKVDTEKFSTNVPGIFAVGDINTYPGKKKLILSGFHECALAAFGAAPFIFPDKKIHLQFTTTSPKLHKVLGVESPVFD